jgi:hypothetical protein
MLPSAELSCSRLSRRRTVAITATEIGYLILGLCVGAVALFCWLGVECRRGAARRSGYDDTPSSQR